LAQLATPTEAAARLAELQDKMGLRDWDITLDLKPADDHTIAQCYTVTGRQVANVLVSKEFWSASEEEQNLALAHELVHCHLARLDEIHDAIAACVSPELARMSSTVFGNQIELTTDAISTAWARAFAT